MGKNFDGTGALGPFFVPATALPPGCNGLHLQTRLNSVIVQDASISDLVFDVQTLVALISEVPTLEAGDLIVTGTPAGVGMARNPKLWMRAGDVCEVEIGDLGALRNPKALFDMCLRASTCLALYVAYRLKLGDAHRAEDFGSRRWPSVTGVALTPMIRSAAFRVVAGWDASRSSSKISGRRSP
jgi:hypothetical protein